MPDSVTRQGFKPRERELRTRLLEAQLALAAEQVPLLVLVAGVEGAGKGEVVNRLTKWLDTRRLQVHAFWDETREDTERPFYWRFWRTLSARGEAALLFGGWYAPCVRARVDGALDAAGFEQALRRARAFEAMLVDDGAVVVKLWFGLSAAAQAQRLDAAAARPLPSADERHYREHYAAFARAWDAALTGSDSAAAPWQRIDAHDPLHRDLEAGEALLRAMQARLQAKPSRGGSAPPPQRQDVLARVDLGKRLDADAYHGALKRLQRRLQALSWEAWRQARSSVLVFEGWDASGKGGVIRRLTAPLDARLYRTIAVGPPSDEERAHHYLWRFWRHLPRSGYMRIYDRSWYGRVLVERVERLTPERAWRRAYAEINQFEAQLVEHGIVLLKFWLHLSKDAQLERFHAREYTPWKRHKLTDEDWRNRDRWDDYEAAVEDMVAATDRPQAPWSLIPAEQKKHARIAVLEQVCRRLQEALD